MKKWSIVALLGISLAAICLGSVIAFVPVAGRVFSGGFQWNLLSARNFSADSVEELRAAVDGPADLKIDTPFGKVDVTAVEGSKEILINAHKYAWGANKRDAEELLGKVKVILQQEGNSVTVHVDQPIQVDILHIGPAGISVDFTVSVPLDCAVGATSSSGNLYLTGTTGDAYLHSSFGQVTVDNVRGKITAETSSGDVTVRNGASGGETVEASSSFGDVQVLHTEGGTLKAKTSSGDVTVEDSAFSGRADVSSSFGDVEVTDLKAGSIEARTNSGEVVLQRLVIEKDLIARSDFGDVEVLDSSADSYDLDTDSGKVTAGDTQGRVKARSGFGDIDIRGTDVILDLNTNSGSIRFSGSLGAGTSILHTDFGDIDVRLPADAPFTFDLSTNFGDVECGFAAVTSRRDSTHLEGAVGAGGPMLEASTNSGSISVQPQSAG
ncbi:MAG: DUF4097 family beta strand repeat protein [Anaerolineales bacterium]|nr:DUF4097 family beta strand repeat protein [Anaerolineales bacterium]